MQLLSISVLLVSSVCNNKLHHDVATHVMDSEHIHPVTLAPSLPAPLNPPTQTMPILLLCLGCVRD